MLKTAIWELRENTTAQCFRGDRGAFRKQTEEFVLKFVAVTMIMRNLEVYGFVG